MKLEVLKEIRKMRKISLGELAKTTGVNADRLSLIERGKVNPSFETVNRMAEGLGCSIVIHLDFGK